MGSTPEWLTELIDNIYKTAIIDQFKHIDAKPDTPFDIHLLVALYNDVFKACTSTSASNPGNANVNEQILAKSKDYVKALLLENDVASLKEAMKQSDTEYLEVWVTRFRKFRILANGLRIVFFYIDNCLLTHSGNIAGVIETFYEQFHDEIYLFQKERQFTAIRNLVQGYRNGVQVSRTLVSNACSTLVDLGKETLLGRNDTELGLRIYRDVNPLFIDDLRVHYAEICSGWANNMPFGQYVDKAKQVFVFELEDIVRMMLVSDSSDGFKRELHELLIKTQLEPLLAREGAINYFLSPENSDKLELQFFLSSSDQDSIKLIADKLQKHLSAHGRDLVKRYTDELNATSAPEKKSALTQSLISDLIQLNHSYESNILNNCGNNVTLRDALSHAFQAFINHDKSVSKYLAEFSHLFLSNHIQSDGIHSNESFYTNIASLYSYIREKDVYQRIHSQRLSQRLLQNTTVGLVQERELIERLHQKTGDPAWRNNAMSMLDNVQESSELSKSLVESSRAKAHLDKLGMDFHLFVCTDQMWPTQTAVSNKDMLSPDLQELLNFSGTFYLQQPNKNFQLRKLMWRLDKGTADLRITFASGDKTINVTTIMMIILSILDDLPEGQKFITFGDLLTRMSLRVTDPEAVVVKNHLHSLLDPMYGIVMKSRKDENTIELTDKLMICKDVAPDYRRVAKIVVPLKTSEDSDESKIIHQELSKARSILIEAALVRVMKARKTAVLDQVRDEVTQQVTQFVVETDMFKTALEQLIQKEFIKRDESDRHMLHYLA